jgi:hypothetical protein
MVDETAFRQVLRSTDPLTCPFGKAILSGCCACPLVARHYIAERESVLCSDMSSRSDCVLLHEMLLHNSSFALKHIHDMEPLTHAQEMKVQCGGLHGLQHAVDGTDEVADVAALVRAACREFGSLEDLPYSLIVQSVASYKMRKRHDEE